MLNIIGIGTDLVKIERIDNVLKKYGIRFAKHILSNNELLRYSQMGTYKKQVHFLAKRFAAKEAFVKALGTGVSEGVILKDIEILHDGLGKPSIHCLHITETKLREKNIQTIHLSLSDEKDYALAFVVVGGS
ncbi:MAG: acpS [Francisellaceae bacterium]|nr:acpS [Francisellaceae bacterium]